MSRRNEIKKDIWTIFRQVYKSSIHVGITDRQDELLNKIVDYLSKNYTLRRKDEKIELPDDAPLERPVAVPFPEHDFGRYKRLRRGLDGGDESTPIVVEDVMPTPKKKVKAMIDLDVSALPPHLRKYVK